MTDTDYALLLSKYHEDRHTLSLKQLGQRELNLWEVFKIGASETERTMDHYHAHHIKFSEDVGVSYNILRQRKTLIEAGAAADPLWEKLQSKRMVPTAADKILLESKKYAVKHNERLADVILRAIAAYDELPVRHLQGIPIRTGKLIIPPPAGEEPEEREIRAPTKVAEAVPTPRANRKTDPNSLFWAKLTNDVKEHVAGQFDATHDVHVEMAMNDFLIELRIIVTEVKDKIRKFERSQERTRKASMMPVERVVDACKAIGIEAPRLGDAIDLNEARKVRRKTLARHHADRPENQGEHAERHATLYRRASDAWDVLELYNSQLNPTGEGNRSHV